MDIEDIIKAKSGALYYRNRLILPFQGTIMKIIIDDDVITDFSPSSKDVYITQADGYTDIYFKQFKDLNDVVSKFEAIKMVIVDKGKDVFNFANHKKLAFYIGEKHQVKIEETEEDILFLE